MDRAVHPRVASTLAQPRGTLSLDLGLSEMALPSRYRGVRLADYEPRDREARRALRRAEELVLGFWDRCIGPRRTLESYPEDRSLIGKGLLLAGPPGTGKTTLGGTILSEVAMRYGVNVHWMPFADWVDMRTQAFTLQGRAKSDEGARVALSEIEHRKDKVSRAALVLLDDVGNEHHGSSDFAVNDFARIIRERHANALPTLVTTNKHPDTWDEFFGPPTASFLHEAFDPAPLNGRDLRLED